MDRVLIAGGGTGGHLYPGLAVAGLLKRRHRGVEVHFVGRRRQLLAIRDGMRLTSKATGTTYVVCRRHISRRECQPDASTGAGVGTYGPSDVFLE